MISTFNDWKKINHELSFEACQQAYIEFPEKKAVDPSLTLASVKLIGPAKAEFSNKIINLEGKSIPHKLLFEKFPR